MGARVELEEFAMRALTYNVAEGFTLDDLQEQDRYASRPAGVLQNKSQLLTHHEHSAPPAPGADPTSFTQ